MLYKKHVISSFIGCAATALFLAACGNDYSIEPSAEDSAIQKMSLREKVGQMFFVRPEALDTSIHWDEYAELPDYKLQKVNKTMRAVNKDYPIGGMILYAHNIVDETQLGNFIAEIRELNGSPLLAIDEEGGRVARIANNENFDVPKYESMAAIADYAPVADVNTNPDNIVDETQLGKFIDEIRELNGSPLLAIDEEGGRVARIANNENFDVPKYESMAAIAPHCSPECFWRRFAGNAFVSDSARQAPRRARF